MLTITIRHAATGATPTSTIVFVTTLMGVLTLGPISFHRLGTDILGDTSATQYAWMLAHERFRRYEVEVPRDCFDETGACEIELFVPEPSHSPYLREVRLEVETGP